MLKRLIFSAAPISKGAVGVKWKATVRLRGICNALLTCFDWSASMRLVGIDGTDLAELTQHGVKIYDSGTTHKNLILNAIVQLPTNCWP